MSGHIYSNKTLSGGAKRSYYIALSKHRRVGKKPPNKTLSGGAKRSYYVALCDYRKVGKKKSLYRFVNMSVHNLVKKGKVKIGDGIKF